MCHALLQTPDFFRLLLRMDEELAAQVQAAGCPCGGRLHRANYPRKPRACPSEVRTDFESRLSFCCNRCRRRRTSMSVRFLGRRVYLGLAVVLGSARHAGQNPAAMHLVQALAVPIRTLQRWRAWWRGQFPLTPLWQAACARFMPPPATDQFPASLLTRFADDAEAALFRLLVFLTPITVRAVTLDEGR
ncbi:MAG: hypothetical protein IPG34_17980 [Rhodocyclaceae bacterium]|nr:hypothetical protein [Rhodocyclaceae bacterium]